MSHAIQTKPSYAEALQSLSTLIPELLGVPGAPRRKFSLEEIRLLSAALGNPHQKFPSILVAGTNGKGSTSATLASIARASGLRVGLYTSPHLDRVNERIRLLLPSNATNVGATNVVATNVGATNVGAPGLAFETGESGDIPDQTFATLYFRVLEAAQNLVATSQLPTLPSFFELLTALAFLYFAEENVDLAVLEVGMGGRLDATNLVSPILSVITDISLDHQEWLGATIALIAREKAGILRENGTLVTLPQHPEANQAIGEVAVSLDVRGISAAEYTPQFHANPAKPYPIQVQGTEILVDSPLKGAHQHRNIALAIAAAVELAENHHYPITPASIEQGIRETHWPGRLESIQIPNQPQWILDVAHNPAGAWALRAALNATNPSTPKTTSTNAAAPGLDCETGEDHSDKSHSVPTDNVGAPGLDFETGEDHSDKSHSDPTDNVGAPGLDFETGVDDSDKSHFDPTDNAGAPGLDFETGEDHSDKSHFDPTDNVGAPGLDFETGEDHSGKSHFDPTEGNPAHAQCLIFACLRDKPLREMSQILFPIFDHVILAPIHSPRATDIADLLAAAEATGTPATPTKTVAEAIDRALALRPARIVVSGSLYLVGEVRTLLLNQKAARRD